MASLLVWRLTGGAANADPNASLGGVSSSEGLSATAMNNLFDDVTWEEAIPGDVEYRALDLFNSGDAAAVAVTVWLNPGTSSEDTVLGLGDGGANATAHIDDESTAPDGISFAEYTPAAKLSLPNVQAGEYRRVWFRRTVDALAGNAPEDTATLCWQYA